MANEDKCSRTTAKKAEVAPGRKDDGSKLPLDLLPWDALLSVANVYKFGAQKYDRRNWEEGISYSRVFAALMRHLLAWYQKGEEFDEEGNSHLDAVVFNALALRTFTLRDMNQFDDRPRPRNPIPPRIANDMLRNVANGYVPGKTYRIDDVIPDSLSSAYPADPARTWW